MFVLCCTSGEEGVQVDCTHTDDERALTGTWVSLVIDKALALRYRMITKYAAWHFEEMMRYEDGVGGLWAEYIAEVEAGGERVSCLVHDRRAQEAVRGRLPAP